MCIIIILHRAYNEKNKSKSIFSLGGTIVIKLICQKCNHVWYTANTRPNQKCGDCGGYLRETELIRAKDIDKNYEAADEKKDDCKIIHLNFK